MKIITVLKTEFKLYGQRRVNSNFKNANFIVYYHYYFMKVPIKEFWKK